MAKLTVQATRGSSTAVDATVSPVTLCVSVTDEEGKPIDGLSKQAFRLTVLQTLPIGGEAGNIYIPIEISGVDQFGLAPGGLGPGFYHVGIKPTAPWSWGAGRIVLGLAVERTRVAGEGPGPAKAGPMLAKVEPDKLGPAKVGPAKPAPTITDVGQMVVSIEVISA